MRSSLIVPLTLLPLHRTAAYAVCAALTAGRVHSVSPQTGSLGVDGVFRGLILDYFIADKRRAHVCAIIGGQHPCRGIATHMSDI